MTNERAILLRVLRLAVSSALIDISCPIGGRHQDPGARFTTPQCYRGDHATLIGLTRANGAGRRESQNTKWTMAAESGEKYETPETCLISGVFGGCRDPQPPKSNILVFEVDLV